MELLEVKELSKEFGTYFDWDYAKKTCVPHSDGDPKHSVYLSIYRVLEHVPMDAIGNMYLVTRDGRSFSVSGKAYEAAEDTVGARAGRRAAGRPPVGEALPLPPAAHADPALECGTEPGSVSHFMGGGRFSCGR